MQRIQQHVLQQEHYMTASDGKAVFFRTWEPPAENSPTRGVVQIVHGMSEHSGRYQDFAEFLARHGYPVLALDLRGHGKTAEVNNEYGFLGESEGWSRVVADMLECSLWMETKWHERRIIMLGHSMGSLLARRFAQQYGERLTALILSGSVAAGRRTARLGRALSRLESRRIGMRTPSPTLTKFIFSRRHKDIQIRRNAFDWLSRDSSKVDEFVNDPLCVKQLSAHFFHDFFKGMEQLNEMDNERRIPKDLPIMMFSGSKDPVGLFSRGVLRIHEKYRMLGLRRIDCRIYEEGRHEMLNEINRSEVYTDILNWFKRRGLFS